MENNPWLGVRFILNDERISIEITWPDKQVSPELAFEVSNFIGALNKAFLRLEYARVCNGGQWLQVPENQIEEEIKRLKKDFSSFTNELFCEGYVLGSNQDFIRSRFLLSGEKRRFFLDCSAIFLTPEEARKKKETPGT
ncbi:MAG: hypothetical protein PHC85_00725 [Candidatus Pacebacteria bacterium]|nr:hypothetical protein [Candidatus Paceibacterota bacterium]